MVIDTSIILAIYFDEPQAAWAANQLSRNASNLIMSTVNLSECLIRIRDRQPTGYDQLFQRLLNSGIRFVAPDMHQAQIAADARIRFPLNLGDCFVYALAAVEKSPILTLDQDFLGVDLTIVHPARTSN